MSEMHARAVEEFSARLRRILVEHKVQIQQLGAALEIHPNVAGNIAGGRFRLLGVATIQRLWHWAEELGYSPAWLFLGTGSVRGITPDAPTPGALHPLIVGAESVPTGADWARSFVPLIGEIAAGPGAGPIRADGQAVQPGAQFVRLENAPPAAAAVRVVGRSMEPAYRDGDILVVDTSRRVRNGLCCVILEQGVLRVALLKVLRLGPAGASLESLADGWPAVRVPEASVLAAYPIAGRAG